MLGLCQDTSAHPKSSARMTICVIFVILLQWHDYDIKHEDASGLARELVGPVGG